MRARVEGAKEGGAEGRRPEHAGVDPRTAAAPRSRGVSRSPPCGAGPCGGSQPAVIQMHRDVAARAAAGAASLNAPAGAGERLATPVRERMERSFGADFSGVRVHVGREAASLGALAYTQGSDLHFAPGQYQPNSPSGQRLIGHELTHVLQQRAGRVRGAQGMGGRFNNDPALEREADDLGARAARGESVIVPGGGGGSSGDVIQAMLGFELEMLVLCDFNGRPPPEKVKLGTVGQHLELTVDQNSAVDAPTPTGEAAADWHLPRANNEDAEIGAYDLPQGWSRRVAYRGAPDQNPEIYADDVALNLAHPQNARPEGSSVFSVYRRGNDGQWSAKHPLGPGMGGGRYASIVEIVTRAYQPETQQGRADIIASMTAAAQLAADIEQGTTNLQNRVRLDTIANVDAASDEVHIGNANQPAQTTDASIQSTLGLDIAQLPSFMKSAMMTGSQGKFNLKHHSDAYDENYNPIDRVKEEIPRAINDATAIINDIGHTAGMWWWKRTTDLTNIRGLLALICQYLRLGRFFFGEADDDRGGLDKNIVPLLSRTNLSAIYRGLPEDERYWLGKHEKEVRHGLYARTGRLKHSTVFTNPQQTRRYAHIPIDVQRFINNIFNADDDGITGLPGHQIPNRLGGFHRMGAENIDPNDNRGGKLGPVFELRNMIPAGLEGGSERFSRDRWVPLARLMITLLQRLNARTDQDAVRDVRVRGNAQGDHARTDPEQNDW